MLASTSGRVQHNIYMPQHAVLEDPPEGDGIGLLERGLLEQDDGDPDSYKKRHTQLCARQNTRPKHPPVRPQNSRPVTPRPR